MRFATWCAVSTAEQAAPDKASLAEQEQKCRAAGEGRGWIESCPPYVASGYSRSFYVNLADAERDIPALRQMLDDARNDKFDVLVIFSYDRLGDLTDMVAQSLSFYNKQIFSVSQPVEPQDPAHFDRYSAEAEAIMRDAARITQRFRINDLRRKWRAGMPKRVDNGLTPLRVPFAYKWRGKKVPPKLDEQEGELLIRMKDMLLAGQPVADLMRYADSTGIKPPSGGRWQDSTIRYMLANPYYAGFVSIKRFTTVRDPRNGMRPRQVPLPRSKWVMKTGKHEPLWDEATWHLLIDELERRKQMNIHSKVRFAFSGLLYCGECGQKLKRTTHGHGNPRRRVVACMTGKSHIIMAYNEAIALVAKRLSAEIEAFKREPPQPVSPDRYLQEIESLRERKQRVQDGYEIGGYDKVEFLRKMTELDNQIEDAQRKVEEAARTVHLRNLFMKRMEKFAYFADWLKVEEPAYVNMVLRAFFEKIILFPDGRVEFIWR